jgi:hypothetical protein
LNEGIDTPFESEKTKRSGREWIAVRTLQTGARKWAVLRVFKGNAPE